MTVEFLIEAYDDMDAMWKDMCRAAEIDVYDTLSLSGSGMTFLGHVE